MACYGTNLSADSSVSARQHPQSQLVEVAGIDGCRGRRQRIRARLRLGEGDDFADVLLAGQQRGQPVDAEGEAGVRRRAVAEGVEQEAELGLRLVLGDAEQAEDL